LAAILQSSCEDASPASRFTAWSVARHPPSATQACLDGNAFVSVIFTPNLRRRLDHGSGARTASCRIGRIRAAHAERNARGLGSTTSSSASSSKANSVSME